MPIIWKLPDNSVRVMQLSERFLAGQTLPGETRAETVARLAEVERGKNPDLASATCTLVRTADMPTDRTARHKWRLAGFTVAVDATIPDPPPGPNITGFLDALDAAFPLATRLGISRQYPWFIEAVKEQKWANVRAYLQHALGAGVLTQAQVDTIRAAATANHIPLGA